MTKTHNESVGRDSIAVVLSTLIDQYTNIEVLVAKRNLTLSYLFTPGAITAIDAEIAANPQILSEALTLVELATLLGVIFYDMPDFVSKIKEVATSVRSDWRIYRKHNDLPSPTDTLHGDQMAEYFVNDAEEFRRFLEHNPGYVGIYIYVYCSAVTMR